MEAGIPTAEVVRARLSNLSYAAVRNLAATSGVPFTTLWKIRSGETADPRLETVRLIWPELIGADGALPVPEANGQEVRDAA